MELFDDMWYSKDIVRDSYLFASQEMFLHLGMKMQIEGVSM